MRNIFSLQIETKISLVIITIAVIIFLVTIFKSLDNFDKFINQFNAEDVQYKEMHLEENP